MYLLICKLQYLANSLGQAQLWVLEMVAQVQLKSGWDAGLTIGLRNLLRAVSACLQNRIPGLTLCLSDGEVSAA